MQTSGNILTFTVAMVTKIVAKIGCIGNWPFFNKIETFDREINIKYKQIPKYILADHRYISKWVVL